MDKEPYRIMALIGILIIALIVLNVSFYTLYQELINNKQSLQKSTYDSKDFTVNEQNVELATTTDEDSPKERIQQNQILISSDKIVIEIDNSHLATFTDSKSMDPIIDSNSKAIEVAPNSEDEISVGDIVAYKPKYKNGIITHRVVEIGDDNLGWYAKLKGDNNEYTDPEKVRFEQIMYVVVAVIY